MRRSLVAVPVLSLALLAFGVAAEAGEPEGLPETLEVSAPEDTFTDELGRFYTRDFRRINAPSLVLREELGQYAYAKDEIKSDCRTVTSAYEILANAAAWGLASASGSKTGSEHYGYCRTVQTVNIYKFDLPDGVSVPEGAFYYVSRVFEGRMYELVTHGDEAGVKGKVSARFGSIDGGVGGSQQASSVAVQQRVVGLSPRENAAVLFSDSPSALQAAFEQSGSPAVVKFRLTAIPSAWLAMQAEEEEAAAQVAAELAASKRYAVKLVSVEFPRLDWDLGSGPDIKVTIDALPKTPQNSPPPFYYSDQSVVRANRDLGEVEIGKGSPLQIRLADADDFESDDPAGSVVITDLSQGIDDGAGNTCFYTDAENPATVCLQFRRPGAQVTTMEERPRVRPAGRPRGR